MASNPETTEAHKQRVLNYLKGLKQVLRELPGFKSIREIVAGRVKPNQRPLQSGNWDTLVLDLGIRGLYLSREGTLVRLNERPDSQYPIFTLLALTREDWDEITQSRGHLRGLFTQIREALIDCSTRAARLPLEIGQLLVASELTSA